MVYRLDVPTASPTPPSPGTVGVEGYPTAGDPGIAPPATIDPYWAYSITEELRNVAVKAGLTPTKSETNQVITGLTTIFSAAPVYVLANESVPVPTWATRCLQHLWGAGGSGSVASAANQRGAGGGAGCFLECLQTGLIGGTSEIVVTIGVGGASVTTGAGNAGTATTTSAGTANGGMGGGNVPYAGGFGGTGTLGAGVAGMVYGAQDGGDGSPNTTESGGNGGGPFGGRGATNNGYPGKSAGGGGGGCAQGFASGAGANGFAILYFMP